MFRSLSRPAVMVAIARRARATSGDAGMATAEYAVTTVAACGFGGVLYKLLSSDFAQSLLMQLIKRAFSFLL
jgi:hypothetical protein